MGMETALGNIEKSKPKGLELFNLDVRQKIELFSRVAESKGLVRIFIHPISSWTSKEETENQDRVTKILKRTINSEKSPPIIILENEQLVEHWKKIFEKSTPPRNIYIVPTLWNFPYPIVPGRPDNLERNDHGGLIKNQETDKYITDGFMKFINLLNDVGVKKMLIGGTNLEIEKDQMYKCVGNFIDVLQKLTDKEIKLSLGTAPLNRNDLKKTHPELL